MKEGLTGDGCNTGGRIFKMLSSHLSFPCSSTVKPKVPTIISVDEVNGNFQVKWKNNMPNYFESSLTAQVMYRKKGDTKNVGDVTLYYFEINRPRHIMMRTRQRHWFLVSVFQVTKSFKPQSINNLNIFEISGEALEPSTTYAVTVRTYTNLSKKFSDSSEEVEFSTRKCPLLLTFYHTLLQREEDFNK